MTKFINLFSGPGAGKSTTAAGIFYKLKQKNIKSELITEYAKDLTYEKGHHRLMNSTHILGEQLQRQERVKGVVDYAVTDSPVILCIAYINEHHPKSFEPFVVDMFNTYDNINFFIERNKPYLQYGRNQSEVEAMELDRKIEKILYKHNIKFDYVTGTDKAADDILHLLGL